MTMKTTPASHNRTLGVEGETLAAAHLEQHGYRILARNWRCRYGELDIVAHDGETVVAVEVKTRSGEGYGSPLEAITAQKASRLRRLLLEWARESGRRRSPLRIDAIGIMLHAGGAEPRIEHLRGIS